MAIMKIVQRILIIFAHKHTRITKMWNTFWSNRAESFENPIEAAGYTERGEVITNEVFDAMRKDIRVKLQLQNTEKLLDVGCGVGMELDYLKNYVSEFWGTDISISMIHRAREKFGERFCVSEGIALPYKDDVFDRVLCNSIFQYFPRIKYARKVIDELVRVAKPGGFILIGDVPDKEKKKQYQDYLGMNRKIRINAFLKPLASRLIFNRIEIEDLFYTRRFFKQVFSTYNGIEYEIFDQEYKPSRKTAELKLRFDVRIRKK